MGDKLNRRFGLANKRKRGKTSLELESTTVGDGDQGSGEEEGNAGNEPLLSFFNQYEDLIKSTADVLKDEIRIIRERKIDVSKTTLEKGTGPEAVRMSKSIVIGFQDSMSKAVKDLQLLGTNMVEELQKRFNLPSDWHQSGSLFGSVSGSEVMGPAFRSTEMHNRISTFINDTAAANEESMRTDEVNGDAAPAAHADDDIEYNDMTGIMQVDSSSDAVSENEASRPSASRTPEKSLIEKKQDSVNEIESPKSSQSSKEKNDPKLACKLEVITTSTHDDTFDDTATVILGNRPTRKAEAEVSTVGDHDDDEEIDNRAIMRDVLGPSTSDSDSTKKTRNLSVSEVMGPTFQSSEMNNRISTLINDTASASEESMRTDEVNGDAAPACKLEVITTSTRDDTFDDADTATVILGNREVITTSTHDDTFDDTATAILGNRPKRKPAAEVRTVGDHDDDDDEEIDNRAIMRDVLGSSSSSSDSDSTKKTRKLSLSKRRKKEKEQDSKQCKEGQDLEASSSKKDNDPKLKCESEVSITRLDRTIEKSLSENGFICLKDFDVLKKKSCADLENQSDPMDSDSSCDSTNEALRKLVKDLTRKSVLRTKKYNKKRGKDENPSRRSKNTKKKKVKDSGKSGELDSDTDSSDDDDFSSSRPPKPDPFKINDDALISDSGSEDLSPASDSTVKIQEKRKSKITTRSKDSKPRKYYKPVSISSDESVSMDEAMREVLGSDSDSDAKGKRSFSQKMKKGKGSDSAADDHHSSADERRTRTRMHSGSDSDVASPRKTRKRTIDKKKQGSDSDVSHITLSSGSDDSDDSDFKSPRKGSKRRRDRDSSPEQGKKSKKKRRRIIVKDSSSNSESDEIQEIPQDTEDTRKNIRKIKSSKQLSKTTKEAEREEEERRRRLAERQKTFNGVHKAPESDKTERLILDADPETNEPLVEVDKTIVAHLKPHQVEGIKFMYNACFESVQMIKEDKNPGGCILAHCMGLGKTLQSVAFMHTMLTNPLCDTKTVLVICPLSTVPNWFNETKNWTEDAKQIKIHKLYEMKNTPASRVDHLNVWQRRGGVGILHYDMFRLLADPKGKSKMKDSLRKAVKEALLDPGPDMVICDEGHLLKNCKSILSLAVNNIRTHRRIVLTGTPLQNNLVEYHTMMNFVKPNLLGSLPEFTNRFVNPIKNGQHADSTDYDVKTMKRRSHVLHRKLEGCVQRCDYLILAPYLPPKYEYIINIKLSDKQEQLYKHYLGNVVDPDPDARRKCLLKYYAELVKVWSHPIALTMRKKTVEDEEVETSDSMDGFIVDGTTEDESEGSNGAPKKSKRKTRAEAANDPEPLNNGNGLDDAVFGAKWWNAVFKSKSEMSDVELSGKLIILQEILKTSETIGDKVLVFSQFLTSLDIIEEFLQDWDKEEEVKEKDNKDIVTFPLTNIKREGRWRRNIEYFRIDGQTKVSDRHRDCEKFNKKSAFSRAKLFLISTKAGGLGINLFGANRVVIFDASWNPSQDMQSIFRVYRFGQDKPCYIYRLIARGTMEEKILRRQITKLSLSSRVVDEHQIQRHFKFDDVNEMYRYDEEDPSSQDAILAVPKDRLLADLLMSHREWIRSYEEFDSLLENKPDEGLSNEEKELAWAEYRIESDRVKSSLPHSNSSMQAETYVKVKPRLAEKYPDASEEQLEQATNISLKVINKIREGMLILNQPGMYDGNPVKAAVSAHIDPLKVWLASSIQPTEVHGTILEDLINKELPVQFYQPLPYSRAVPQAYNNPFYAQYSQQNVRPPIIRRPMRMPQSQMPVQNIHNNFQTIASNAVPSVRAQLLQQRLQDLHAASAANANNAMNGQQ